MSEKKMRLVLVIGLEKDEENGDVAHLGMEMTRENGEMLLREQEECGLLCDGGALEALIDCYATVNGYRRGYFVNAYEYEETAGEADGSEGGERVSKNGLGSLRVMVIDVEGDKILRDELCDAIVAGLARDGDRGKGEKVSGCSFGIAKGSVGTMVASCMAAEQAIEKVKERCVKEFVKTAFQDGLSDLDNLDEMLDKVIDSDLGGEDSSDEC